MSGQQIKKADLVAEISENTGVDRKAVSSVLDNLAVVVTKEVGKGNSVMLAGLGKFASRERPARTVRNPSTGESIQKPADRAVRVTVAKALKDSVN